MNKKIISKILILAFSFSCFTTSYSVKGEENQSTEENVITSDEKYTFGDLGSEESEKYITEKGEEYGKSLQENSRSITSKSEETETYASKVDNSADTDLFPKKMAQEEINCCTCAAGVYYQYSYMVNKLYKELGSDTRVTFSPRFTYAMIEGGGNVGANDGNAYASISAAGAVDEKYFPFMPYKYPIINYSKWADEDVYKEAQRYGIEKINCIYPNDEIRGTDCPKLREFKKALDKDKCVMNFPTYFLSGVFGLTEDDPDTDADNSTVGEPILEYTSNTKKGGHALTIVGYDDDIWVDINHNGTVDEGEKGAFKVVNSWGENYKQAIQDEKCLPKDENGKYQTVNAKGYFWMAYDSLNSHSQLKEQPEYPNGRSGSIRALYSAASVSWITPKIYNDDDMKLYAKIKLRGNIASDSGKIMLKAVNKETGKSTNINPLSGVEIQNTTDNFDGGSGSAEREITVILSRLVEGITQEDLDKYTWELSSGTGAVDDMFVESFSILDEKNNKKYDSNINQPVNIKNISSYGTKLGEIDTAENNNFLQSVNINLDKKSGQTVGNTIKIKADTVGSGKLKYTFSIKNKNQDNEEVFLSKDSTSDTVTWTPSSTGTYIIKSVVKDEETGKEVSTSIDEFQINEKLKLLAVGELENAKHCHRDIGERYHISALAEGGTGKLTYHFMSSNEGDLGAITTDARWTDDEVPTMNCTAIQDPLKNYTSNIYTVIVTDEDGNSAKGTYEIIYNNPGTMNIGTVSTPQVNKTDDRSESSVISWEPCTTTKGAIAGYDIYKNGQVIDRVKNTTYTIEKGETTDEYKVQAVNDSNSYSPLSNGIVVSNKSKQLVDNPGIFNYQYGEINMEDGKINLNYKGICSDSIKYNFQIISPSGKVTNSGLVDNGHYSYQCEEKGTYHIYMSAGSNIKFIREYMYAVE